MQGTHCRWILRWPTQPSAEPSPKVVALALVGATAQLAVYPAAEAEAAAASEAAVAARVVRVVAEASWAMEVLIRTP